MGAARKTKLTQASNAASVDGRRARRHRDRLLSALAAGAKEQFHSGDVPQEPALATEVKGSAAGKRLLKTRVGAGLLAMVDGSAVDQSFVLTYRQAMKSY